METLFYRYNATNLDTETTGVTAEMFEEVFAELAEKQWPGVVVEFERTTGTGMVIVDGVPGMDRDTEDEFDRVSDRAWQAACAKA